MMARRLAPGRNRAGAGWWGHGSDWDADPPFLMAERGRPGGGPQQPQQGRSILREILFEWRCCAATCAEEAAAAGQPARRRFLGWRPAAWCEWLEEERRLPRGTQQAPSDEEKNSFQVLAPASSLLQLHCRWARRKVVSFRTHISRSSRQRSRLPFLVVLKNTGFVFGVPRHVFCWGLGEGGVDCW